MDQKIKQLLDQQNKNLFNTRNQPKFCDVTFAVGQEKKEFLAKFLDLEIFDKKFKMAKEDSAMTKAALRRLEGTDFETQISEVKRDITKKAWEMSQLGKK